MEEQDTSSDFGKEINVNELDQETISSTKKRKKTTSHAFGSFGED
jgi:hypothetical protein